MRARALSWRALLAAVALAGRLVAAAPELVVHAPPELAAAAREIGALGAGDFSALLVTTGTMGFGAPIQVVLVPETGAAAMGVPAWVAGFARGADGVVVLFPERVRSYPDGNLRTLLAHEVAHVLVARAAGGGELPRWFNEGLATAAAREWGLEDRARAAAAVLGRQPRRASELDAWFRGDGSEVTRAYALSSGFVRFLIARYGQFAPAEILAGVARGLDFEGAFRVATGVPLARAEQLYFVREAWWNTWVPVLTSSGVLWAAITALALVAIRRRRVRSAAQYARWEEEERVALAARAEDDATVN